MFGCDDKSHSLSTLLKLEQPDQESRVYKSPSIKTFNARSSTQKLQPQSNPRFNIMTKLQSNEEQKKKAQSILNQIKQELFIGQYSSIRNKPDLGPIQTKYPSYSKATEFSNLQSYAGNPRMQNIKPI